MIMSAAGFILLTLGALGTLVGGEECAPKTVEELAILKRCCVLRPPGPPPEASSFRKEIRAAMKECQNKIWQVLNFEERVKANDTKFTPDEINALRCGQLECAYTTTGIIVNGKVVKEKLLEDLVYWGKDEIWDVASKAVEFCAGQTFEKAKCPTAIDSIKTCYKTQTIANCPDNRFKKSKICTDEGKEYLKKCWRTAFDPLEAYIMNEVSTGGKMERIRAAIQQNEKTP